MLKVKDMTYDAELILSDLSPACSPFGWIEPNDLSKSTCFVNQNIDEYQVRAEGVRFNFARNHVQRKVNDIVNTDGNLMKFKEELKNSNDSNEPSGDKLTEISKKIMESRASDFQGVVLQEKQELARQTPVPKEAKGNGYLNREDFFNALTSSNNSNLFSLVYEAVRLAPGGGTK